MLPETPIPVAPDGRLPPLPVLIRHLEEHLPSSPGWCLAEIPLGNAVLPELLAGFGITTLRCDRPELPALWRWQAVSGAEILVRRGPQAEASSQLPCHCGELPGDGRLRRSSRGVWLQALRLWRYQAAAAALDGTHDVADFQLLARLLAGERPAGPPPLIGRQSLRRTAEGKLLVWNPLPMPAACQLLLDLDESETVPWSLLTADGLAVPVQLCEGPLGRQMLCRLELPAGGCASFAGSDEPAASAAWEVDRLLLDNGIVRAELDAGGGLRRLCIDGHFVNSSAPLLLPELLPNQPPAEISILEDGPVRARLQVERRLPGGVLQLTYSLLLGADRLDLVATWTVTEPGRPEAATAGLQIHGAGPQLPLVICQDSGECQSHLARARLPPTAERRQYSCAAVCCDDPRLARLAILAEPDTELELHCQEQVLNLPIDGRLACSVTVLPESWQAVDLLRQRLTGGARARLAASPTANHTPFHCYDDRDLLPVAFGPAPAASAGRFSLVLHACGPDRGTARLRLEQPQTAPEHRLGKEHRALQPDREPDTWMLPYRPGQIFRILW